MQFYFPNPFSIVIVSSSHLSQCNSLCPFGKSGTLNTQSWISTTDWVQFTCWWFGVVLSQVIPSEVQDNTGDNIEKPGKILNGETLSFHILNNFACPFNVLFCGWRLLCLLLFFLALCTISWFRFAKLKSNMPVVFFFFLDQEYFCGIFYVPYVAVVSSRPTQSLIERVWLCCSHNS